MFDAVESCEGAAGCIVFYFPLGAFSAIGTYTDVPNNDATLTVSAAPEPSALLLLCAGLLGLTAMTRRRTQPA